MDRDEGSEPVQVAYLLKCFPRVSETFILHEILELERQGLPLQIFSLLYPVPGKVAAAVREVRATVTYLPQTPGGLLAAAARRARRAPGRFLGTALAALVRYKHPKTILHVLYAAALAEHLERTGTTHLHAHYANAPATVAEIVQRLTGIPYSVTAHAKDIYLSRRPTLAYKLRQARFVVTCTAYNQRYLTALAGPSLGQPIHCIYHGLNLGLFPPPPSDATHPPGRPLILSVARLIEKKGLPYLLQACRGLADQSYDFTCRIVGEGPLRPQLEQQIQELGLAERVQLWGEEAHEQVIAMYQEAAIMALPCVIGENGDRDGIPNALVEAMHMGVPIVSTPVSGIPELISAEVNGLLVPPKDSAALTAGLARLLDDPILRNRLAVAGQQTVLEHFDMARNATRLHHLLRGAARAGSAGARQ